VKQLAENSPMVAFQQGGVTVMMDTDAFDYTYGDAEGPDPAQRDLDALLTRATRICVLEGPMFQGRAVGGQILLDLRGANALRDLASCLQIVEDPRTFNHCQCLGGPTMELYAGLEHIATIGLQHGKAIRWKQWYHDAQLQDGDRLTRWMIDRGVDPAQLEAIYRRGNNFLFAKPSDSPDRVKVAQNLCCQAQEEARQGKFTEALEHCTQALELDSDQAGAYALRGQMHYHSARLRQGRFRLLRRH